MSKDGQAEAKGVGVVVRAVADAVDAPYKEYGARSSLIGIMIVASGLARSVEMSEEDFVGAARDVFKMIGAQVLGGTA